MAVAPSPDGLTTHYAVSHWRAQVYFEGIHNGTFQPFVVPFFLLGYVPLLTYFLVPTLQGTAARFVTFASTVAFYGWIILNCRAYGTSAGFGIGVMSGWNILWAAVLLWFRDAKLEFERVKSSPGDQKLHPEKSSKIGSSELTSAYHWQSFPSESLGERVGWALDLITNFRGIGWNWRISGMPTRPPGVESSLHSTNLAEVTAEDRPITSTGRRRFETVGALVRSNLWILLSCYVLLDILKVFVNHDPYFWGLTDQPPPIYLPSMIVNSIVLTRIYRTLVTCLYLYATLNVVFAAGPLIYAGLLGSGVLGSAGESWTYPDQYGNYSVVYERGLAGFWGGWWHQIFRFGFQAGGRWLTKDVLGLSDKSPISAVVQLSTSFNISGFIHATASMTMIGNTNPVMGSGLFFALQPVGIIAGLIWQHLWKKSGLGARTPKWVGWGANFAYTHAWLYLTAPLLTEDLIRGGLLLGEPVPFSPLRGIGLGAEGDQFYCWGSSRVAWHDSPRWLSRGIAL